MNASLIIAACLAGVAIGGCVVLAVLVKAGLVDLRQAGMDARFRAAANRYRTMR